MLKQEAQYEWWDVRRGGSLLIQPSFEFIPIETSLITSSTHVLLSFSRLFKVGGTATLGQVPWQDYFFSTTKKGKMNQQ